MAARLRKGDQIIVLAGKYKGQKGEIIQLLPNRQRVLVRGVNIVKRHTRPSQQNAGGIISKELPIHASNVGLLDPDDNKATRIGFRIENGVKQRYARRSGKAIAESKK